MMDLLLAQALLQAVPPGAHLLLVGDPDQLPSVGPGNVLSGLVRKIHRDATTLSFGSPDDLAAIDSLLNA